MQSVYRLPSTFSRSSRRDCWFMLEGLRELALTSSDTPRWKRSIYCLYFFLPTRWLNDLLHQNPMPQSTPQRTAVLARATVLSQLPPQANSVSNGFKAFGLNPWFPSSTFYCLKAILNVLYKGGVFRWWWSGGRWLLWSSYITCCVCSFE